MEDEKIITEILYKLDGWILEDDLTSDITDMDFNKVISNEEVLHFYNTAYNYALAYTRLNNFPQTTRLVDGEEVTDISDQCFTALCLWAAGLIYRKYNIRTNDQIEETNTLGYGDSLIIQAKEMLKGLKSYGFYAY